MISESKREAARTFILLNGRILDRRRYAYLFENGDAEAVKIALRSYQNPDGGFGHALEPDSRGTSSHPTTVYTALRILDEIGGFDDLMASNAADYLESVAAVDGGVPVAMPSLLSE